MSEDWQRGADGFYRKCQGYTVVTDDPNHVTIPLCCPVCDLPMTDSDDHNAYKFVECCDKCHLRWAQSRIQDWKDGWRPSETDLEAYVAIRQSQPPKFSFG